MERSNLWIKIDNWTRLSRLSYPVPPHAKNLFYTIGGVTFVGFLVLFATGILIAQFFNPLPEQANQSVRYLIEKVKGGSYIRSVHYWIAQAVVISLLFHLLRVFITGAYKYPRVLTWFIGVGLLSSTYMGSYFTGTVLKWDQEGFEAMHHYKVIVDSLGPFGFYLGEGLTKNIPLNIRLYVSHITFFPLVLISLIVAHFYLIRVFNISPLPWGQGSMQTEVPAEGLTGRFTEHLRAIALYSFVYYGIFAIIALFIPAPLGPEHTGVFKGEKPPWPFLWLYGLENFFGIPAILYGSLIFFALLAIVPFLDYAEERNPMKRKKIIISAVLILLILLSLTIYGWLSPEQVHDDGSVHPHH